MSKGQVTVFIILGIILVAIVGMLFYFRNQIIESDFQSEREKAALVPEQIRPVKLFVDNCVDEVSRDAINLAGFQGGHVELEDDSLPVTEINPFSNKLKLSSKSGASVSYWSYKTANGVRRDAMPGQEDIENGIANYIAFNVNDCLDNLDFFYNDGYNITRDRLENVDVRMLDNNVEVIVEQPIKVNYKEIDFTMEKHYADVLLPLGLFYDIARQVYENEESSYFLEDKTIDMLVVYDELPYSDTDIECNAKIWTRSQVEKELREIIESNMAALRVKGSSYRLIDEDNSYFELDVLDDRVGDVSVGFTYSRNWPMNVIIEPSDGEILRGDSLNQDVGNDLEGFLTSLFCLNNYNFVYDIRYPVLVTISNDDYTFQYAVQVEIDNNQPRINLLGEEEVIDLGSEICQATTENEVRVNTLAQTPDNQLLQLDDVDVSYKCITQTCNIGLSNNGIVDARFPACLNGIVIGKKEGFGVAKTILSSNEVDDASLVLKPLYTKNIEVNLIEKKTGEIRKPYESEKIVFEFNSDDYDTSVVWPDNNQVILLPGSYRVKSYVIGESTWDIQIASKNVESCVEVPNGVLGIFGDTKTECRQVEVPGMTLEEAIKGGENFGFEAGHAELAYSNKIVLYTMVDNIPGSYDGLTQIYDEIEDNIVDGRFRYPSIE